MAAKYILAVVAVGFLAAALFRVLRGEGARAQTKTWLLVGLIFTAVSAWLFW